MMFSGLMSLQRRYTGNPQSAIAMAALVSRAVSGRQQHQPVNDTLVMHVLRTDNKHTTRKYTSQYPRCANASAPDLDCRHYLPNHGASEVLHAVTIQEQL
jgi:hypothetical protein